MFELHGWGDTSERLHALQRQGDFAGMAQAITDDMLDVYSVESTWDDLPGVLLERYGGRAERVFPYFAADGWRADPGLKERWRAVASAIRSA